MSRRATTGGVGQQNNTGNGDLMAKVSDLKSKHLRNRSVWPKVTTIVVVLLSLHAAFKTVSSSTEEHAEPFPDLFIYRRTKKSGSSSMLTELLDILVPLGYQPLYLNILPMNVVVRHEFIRSKPRRLLVAEHNEITKQDHPHRNAVIADTIRDGYAQITSYCRYVKHVKQCNDKIIECIRSNITLKQITYRWAGRPQEDEDTFIDLPLSAAHPALSTAVLRTVFPNVVVREAMYNVKSSSCEELPNIREAYNSMYKDLDTQVLMLRRRLLRVAGHPDLVQRSERTNESIDALLEEAEQRERNRFSEIDFSVQSNNTGYSHVHHELILGMRHWSMKPTSELYIKASRK